MLNAWMEQPESVVFLLYCPNMVCFWIVYLKHHQGTKGSLLFGSDGRAFCGLNYYIHIVFHSSKPGVELDLLVFLEDAK